jgi:RNA polymerase sigma factor (sigma-70 family)
LSSDDSSVTRQIGQLKAGDQDAAVPLWRRYFQRMVRIAGRRLSGRSRQPTDAEDVALAAFARFCQEAERGRLPQVRNPDDLWRVLVTLTIRTAIDEVRREGRQRRGGRANYQEETAATAMGCGANPDQLVDQQPAPEYIVQVAEECELLLGGLDDETLKSIAVWKTEGYTNEEIAAKLGVVLRTVERKLHTIRARWLPAGSIGPSTGASSV